MRASSNKSSRPIRSRCGEGELTCRKLVRGSRDLQVWMRIVTINLGAPASRRRVLPPLAGETPALPGLWRAEFVEAMRMIGGGRVCELVEARRDIRGWPERNPVGQVGGGIDPRVVSDAAR